MSSKQVFISYAWGGLSEEVAKELESLLTQHKIDLTRDKTDLGFKGLIREFMQQIGKGDVVILIISDKYLKSKNCMFELLEAEKKGEFYKRIFPIVLPDADIYDSLGMVNYLKYWDQKIKELNQSVKELENLADTRKIQEDINLYTDIRGAFDDLASRLSNMNTLTLELMRSKEYQPLLSALKEGINPPPAPTPSKKEGKVLYHIPGMMQVDTWTRCTVRLAWDEILLQENLKIPEEERSIESIRLGEIMQVSLIQGKGGSNFEIHALNNEEQFISEDDFTEWLFEVKPLIAGKFSLILRISLIQIIEGKERKKDLVLEREVTAEAVVPQALPKFETAESGLSISKKPAEQDTKSPAEAIFKNEKRSLKERLPADFPEIPEAPPHPSAKAPTPKSLKKTSILRKILPYAASITVIFLAAIILFPSNSSMENSPISQAPDEYYYTDSTSGISIPLGGEVLIAMSLDPTNPNESSSSKILVFSMEAEEFLALQEENMAGVSIYSLDKEDTIALNLGPLRTISLQEVKDSVQVTRRTPVDSRKVNPELQKLKTRPRIDHFEF
ncbi:toll/interleukin-1 receptor domain-containing protein [Algoriphagus mannitolivorans]|uniref:toll/interleukin-1 receptor domain-containing protein n=1 Tax=Algoriphagus mannitolivorans TaxID=226504 RepID=UPI00040F8601|nr:toll/interleukin-1 receptor domain-containing protein [Algoriphagus mannitolivorans]